MNIYKKRGQPNHKEKLLIKKLTEYFNQHPERYVEYTPAVDFEELKKAHDYFLTEEAVVLEETKSHESDPIEDRQSDLFTPQEDPINRDEPKIREYVLNSELSDQKASKAHPSSSYAEPTSFKESFEILDEDDQIREEKKGPINERPIPPKDKTPDPDAKIKRKSKKKFTKYAVDAVCALAGRGIVWFATKDITEERLQELVMNDEISDASLKMLVYLDHNTQGTVKQFFNLHVTKAQDLANFTEDERDDLSDALEDWMEFKKIEINPTVQLGTILLGMIFNRAMAALQYKAETTSVLNQLRNIHAGELQKVHSTPPPAEQQKSEPTPEPVEGEYDTEQEKTEE